MDVGPRNRSPAPVAGVDGGARVRSPDAGRFASCPRQPVLTESTGAADGAASVLRHRTAPGRLGL